MLNTATVMRHHHRARYVSQQPEPTTLSTKVVLTHPKLEPNRFRPGQNILRFTLLVMVGDFAFVEMRDFILEGGHIQIPKIVRKGPGGTTIKSNVCYPHPKLLGAIYDALRKSGWLEKYEGLEPLKPYSPKYDTPYQLVDADWPIVDIQ